MDVAAELTKRINQMLKETEKIHDGVTETRQDYYYTGYVDALLAVLQLLEDL